MKPGYSLRRRTLNAFLLPLIVAAVAVTLAACLFAYRDVSAQRDEHMRQTAGLLLLLGRHEAAERDGLGDVEGNSPMLPDRIEGSEAEFRIWSDIGVVTQSSGMPSLPRRTPPGFHTMKIDGIAWRILATSRGGAPSSDSAITVELAEPVLLREWQAVRLVLSLAIPLALLVIAVAVISSQQVGKAMQPLQDLSAQLDRRDAADLSLVGYSALPWELAPLVKALNGLFLRLRDAFEREREFSDNAAHELRTPVAALKTRAQLLERKLAANPEAASDVSQFIQAVDRTAYVIDRLLEFARMTGPSAALSEFDLSSAIEDEARMLAPMALAKPLSLEVDITPGFRLRGAEDALRLAFRNLFLNAIKFTPPEGRIALRLAHAKEGWTLSLTDNGPGIEPGDEERMFERFWRGNTAHPGSGLGLALVRRVAEMHGGRAFARRVEPEGLTVGFTLPG